jgi:aryl-alcohol dehydrogenase-like predicted oxidoreductase
VNKVSFRKKIIIGTANFTQKYGQGLIQINDNETKKIFNLAKEKKIYEIDTAEAYLKNNKIFQNIDKKFQFSTKILPDKRWLSLEFCQHNLENHFKSLNTQKVKTLFFHDTKILYSRYGLKIFKNLEVLKKNKFFKKIGLSIYDTECLNYLVSKYNFDVVQIPYNILDKRIITSGWLNKLKDKKIETQIRSIFLQGLLVNQSVYKKKYFIKYHNFFLNWFIWLKNNNISPIDYCLSDLFHHDFDKIVIGINNVKNFKEIINFKKIKKNNMIDLKLNDLKVIDPRKWKNDEK